MANKTPFFLTGGNARIILNNKTVAYATSVSYRISVRHAAPRVLGRFEVEVIQPLTYDVTGSLSIIRYGRGLKSFYGNAAPEGVSELGNSIGSYSSASAAGIVGSALGLPTTDGQWDGRADEAFNPSKFFQSMMFNIEIRQTGLASGGSSNNQFFPEPPAQGGGKDIAAGTALGKVLKKAAQIGNSKISTKSENETPVVTLRDCRFEDMAFSLDKRGVATISMTFRARYADDDTTIARKSGVGQELS